MVRPGAIVVEGHRRGLGAGHGGRVVLERVGVGNRESQRFAVSAKAIGGAIRVGIKAEEIHPLVDIFVFPDIDILVDVFVDVHTLVGIDVGWTSCRNGVHLTVGQCERFGLGDTHDHGRACDKKSGCFQHEAALCCELRTLGDQSILPLDEACRCTDMICACFGKLLVAGLVAPSSQFQESLLRYAHAIHRAAL